MEKEAKKIEVADFDEKLRESRAKLLDLQVQHSQSVLKDTSAIKKAKKEIAKILAQGKIVK